MALAAAPSAALSAEFHVLPNGTAYNASVEVVDAERFEFYEPGVLGERVPLTVSNVQITGNCSPCAFTATKSNSITFSKGNYTIRYTAPLRDFHLQAVFEKPYSVNVSLPEGFDIRNPLLAFLSPGSTVIAEKDNSTTARWNRTLSVDLRFYDRSRESLLYLFGNFWIVIAIVLLLPFLFTMKKNE